MSRSTFAELCDATGLLVAACCITFFQTDALPSGGFSSRNFKVNGSAPTAVGHFQWNQSGVLVFFYPPTSRSGIPHFCYHFPTLPPPLPPPYGCYLFVFPPIFHFTGGSSPPTPHLHLKVSHTTLVFIGECVQTQVKPGLFLHFTCGSIIVALTKHRKMLP